MEILHLNNETIDLLSEKIGEMYKGLGCDKKETFRAKLLLEEALIKYQSRFGEDIEIYYRIYRVFSQTRFCIRLRAPSFDPFSLEENPMSFMIQSIMSNFESTMPTWKYHNLENEIVFTLKKKAKRSGLFKIGVSVAASLLLGVAARLWLPASVLSTIVNDYFEPLSDAYAGAFCVMAVLLTMFAITLSIVHIGDIASVGALGGRIMRRFLIMTAVLVTILILPLLPFFEIGGNGAISVAAKSIYDIVIGFIPTNLVAPFLNFNSVHIMLIGLMFGFSLLTMGQKGETVVKLFDECNLVAVYTNNFINRFIFIYVGMKVFTIVTTSEFSMLAGAGKMIGAIVAGELIIMTFYTVSACVRGKVPFSKFAKTAMTPFMICLSSANFGATFSSMFDSLFALDVDGDTANLSVNLGSVLFQPCCTLSLVISALFMASSYGVEISVIWIVTAVVLSTILVSTMPNIPGAAVSVITLLYAQLGLPAEAVALMITINAILQFLTVGIDAWCLVAEGVIVSSIQKKKQVKA